MKATELIAELLNAAEKSAEMARAIRREETLFQLLIEEKTGDDKGRRFGFDFKTLADVIIQEMVRKDLDRKFSGLGKRVTGEENSKFTNTVGEKVNLEIKDNKKKMISTLMKVLDGNERAATALVNLVFSDVSAPESPELQKFQGIDIDKKSIGIWIDPIDGTAEYITGARDAEFKAGENISQKGLPNVTVLIGVYDKASGRPLIGVVNQPFFKSDDGKNWSGRTVWGATLQGVTALHLPDSKMEVTLAEENKHAVLTSLSDCKKLGTYLCEKFEILTAPGAGYKLLCVIDRLASAYVLSKDNTYRWDTCAPHAILIAMGGGVVTHREVLTADFSQEKLNQSVKDLQITYHRAEPKAAGSNAWCNAKGVIAYVDEQVLVSLAECLSKK